MVLVIFERNKPISRVSQQDSILYKTQGYMYLLSRGQYNGNIAENGVKHITLTLKRKYWI